MTALTGTGRLVRLALRRDRIQLPAWVLVLALLTWVTVSSIVGLYPGDQQRVALAVASANSPVSLMTNGLVSGASLGATVTTQAFVFLAAGASLMSTLVVVRHSRQNEETGRAELVGAGVVGRYAPLTAALVAASAANVALAVVAGLILVGSGLPVAGSVLFAAALGGVGIGFATVAAVAAQVAETSRGANALAAGALGVAFLLRAIGDASGKVVDGGLTVISAWPSWLSPIGWGQQARAYDRDQWWVLGLLAVFGAGLVTTAYVLASHRDLGAGLRAVRPGRPEASPALLSPLGLAWWLQRGVLLGWAVGLATLGATYGGVGDEIREIIGDNPEMAEAFERLGGAGSITDTFFAVTLRIAALAAAAYGVQAMLRMRSEEAAGRVEPLLGTAVSRARWMTSNMVVGVLGVIALLVIAGASEGLSYGLVVGDGVAHVARLTGAALAHAPAALVLAGLAVVAFGLVPHWAVAISWAAVAASLVLIQLGALFDLPQTVLDLSPFTHIPPVPAADLTPLPLVVLVAVAVAFGVTGVAAFRRRDLALP
jgi:ABC-2 type transport system permease protein